MKTKEEILYKNGFDFDAFKYENEYSAKNLLLAMEEYAAQFKQPEPEPVKRNKYGVIKQLEAPNEVACDFCLYENSKETEPCRNCTDRIGIYEYYKRD